MGWREVRGGAAMGEDVMQSHVMSSVQLRARSDASSASDAAHAHAQCKSNVVAQT